MQGEFQPPTCQTLIGVSLRFPGSFIPKHHSPAAILAFGNDAFKASVFNRVIFYLNRQPLISWIVAGTFGYGPTLQDPAPAETKIIVQPCRRVFLDDKRQ